MVYVKVVWMEQIFNLDRTYAKYIYMEILNNIIIHSKYFPNSVWLKAHA